ncbi:MAG: LLM class F420-dependent oxidoreductase [bacterium]|nr:LLM class F420-dependent oxidoreductase [Gammaproteobacteria bacterium]HIL99097.1 LLM class F420-dependent oxidoreductase [Pseudomonadales bacterium]
MMDIGLFVLATEYAMPIDELARAAEERGFESLWIPEHSHIPLDSAYPGDVPIPKDYAHTYDPFISLTIAASVTSTIRLGTGICLVIERDTILTAKEVSTLDRISGGRFEFGIGAGWNRKEMENHGTVYDTRFDRLRDQIMAMRTIWTEEEAEYHGEFVDFDPMWAWPKPAQDPYPPILLGGESIHTLRRIVDYCDGWLPRARNPEKLLEGMETLRRLADDAGRGELPVSVFATPPKWITRFADAGVKRNILIVPAEGSDATLKRLDTYAEFLQGSA